MMRSFVGSLALLATTATAGWAQGADAPRERVGLAVLGGGYAATAEFEDGSRFTGAGTVGGAVTAWASRQVGLRAVVLRTRTGVDGPAGGGLSGQDPTIWFYSGDLLLRLPIESMNRWGWSPYLLGGLGAKRYAFESSSHLRDRTDFAGSAGAGLEYRFGRWGVHAEARGFLSRFRRLGYDDRQRDLVYTAGLSLSL